MDPVWQIIIAILTSSAFTGIIVKLIEVIADANSKKKKEAREAILEHNKKVDKLLDKLQDELIDLKDDNLVILHDRIYAMFKKFEKQDTLTASDRSNLDYVYERYSNRGGNHDAKILYNLITEKPVIPGGLTE